MSLREIFPEADLAAVRQAVEAAEARTAGEIVPYVVDESDPYPDAAWKGAAWGALLFPVLAWAVHQLAGFWGAHLLVWMVLPAGAGAAVGYLAAAFVPALTRLLAGDDLLELRTRRRAAVAFLAEEVWRTHDRTGILIFVSLFERRVVILADSGIHAQVEEARWQAISSDVARGLAAGRAGDALLGGIRACGELLAERGVERRPDDADELSNELRRERR
jgi:putative membrane protein